MLEEVAVAEEVAVLEEVAVAEEVAVLEEVEVAVDVAEEVELDVADDDPVAVYVGSSLTDTLDVSVRICVNEYIGLDVGDGPGGTVDV